MSVLSRLRPASSGGVLALALCLLLGCESLQLEERSKGSSLLKPAQMSPDSVGLEIIFVRSKLDDAEVNADLWSEVDEQQLPAELRRQLAENGFRAGIIGTSVPKSLEKLLGSAHLNEKPTADGAIAKLDDGPAISGRRLQIRSGQPTEIQASKVHDQLPLLVRKQGEVVGNTLSKAQGVFIARATPEAGGGVQLSLIPELQWGETSQKVTPTQEGVWKVEASRKREVFSELAIDAKLTPGQLLLITCLPERSGSLGQHFFADRTATPAEQKLILVRLSQTQQSGL
jgi:hypothetical protein